MYSDHITFLISHCILISVGRGVASSQGWNILVIIIIMWQGLLSAVCVQIMSKSNIQSDILREDRKSLQYCLVLVIVCVQIFSPRNWEQIATLVKHWIWLESDSFLVWRDYTRIRVDPRISNRFHRYNSFLTKLLSQSLSFYTAYFLFNQEREREERNLIDKTWWCRWMILFSLKLNVCP